VVVLIGLWERKVSPFDLVVPNDRVPGTLRVERKELKTVVREERRRAAPKRRKAAPKRRR
jgi:hypothetical protein